MFNLGMGEMLIIAAIILIFIGPRQLPEVARTIAKFVNEWKRATTDLSQSLMEARDVTETAVKDAVGDMSDFDVNSSEKTSEVAHDDHDPHYHPIDNDHSDHDPSDFDEDEDQLDEVQQSHQSSSDNGDSKDIEKNET